MQPIPLPASIQVALGTRDYARLLRECEELGNHPEQLRGVQWNTSEVMSEVVVPHMRPADLRGLFDWLPADGSDAPEGIDRCFVVEMAMRQNYYGLVDELYTAGWRPSEEDMNAFLFMLTDACGEVLGYEAEPTEADKRQAQWFVSKGLARAEELPAELLA